MEPHSGVIWYTFAWNDVLRLPMPEEVRRNEVEVFIDREVKTLLFWEEREPRELGQFPWSWVREDLRIAEWVLGDWFNIFRDLRIFFYVHLPRGEAAPGIHLLAVQEDGEEFRTRRLDVLLARREEVLAHGVGA